MESTKLSKAKLAAGVAVIVAVVTGIVFCVKAVWSSSDCECE